MGDFTISDKMRDFKIGDKMPHLHYWIILSNCMYLSVPGGTADACPAVVRYTHPFQALHPYETQTSLMINSFYRKALS